MQRPTAEQVWQRMLSALDMKAAQGAVVVVGALSSAQSGPPARAQEGSQARLRIPSLVCHLEKCHLM